MTNATKTLRILLSNTLPEPVVTGIANPERVDNTLVRAIVDAFKDTKEWFATPAYVPIGSSGRGRAEAVESVIDVSHQGDPDLKALQGVQGISRVTLLSPQPA